MSKQDLRSQSKFLSYILRHHPEAIDLNLDRRGWAQVEELIDKADKNGRSITLGTIKKIMQQGDKNRFVLSDDERFIRAGYGHSIEVDLGLQPLQPPSILFHGTAGKNINAIRWNGLIPGSRNYVHLSADINDARTVGSRHGKPVILKISAEEMYNNGFPFYQSESERSIWLVENVPQQFLTIFDD